MTRSFKVAFIGPSCAGKTTAYTYASDYLHGRGIPTYWLNVATPLHDIQRYIRWQLRTPPFPATAPIAQDGPLLKLLAETYTPELLALFKTRYQEYERLHAEHALPRATINTDCRNNAYGLLRQLQFRFVRIRAVEADRRERAVLRGDRVDASFDQDDTDTIEAEHEFWNHGSLAELKANVETTLAQMLETSRY